MKDAAAAEISELQDAIEAVVPGATGISTAKKRSVRSRKLRILPQDYGRAEGIRHAILTLVNDEHYQPALNRLKEFEKSKSEFPQFAVRAERYLKYSADLINAIKAKRSFPNLDSLAVTKQQELYDRAMEHVTELIGTLRKIEQMDVECRAEDRRTSVWPLKAFFYCLFAIMGLVFFRELTGGAIPTFGIVADDLLNRIANGVFELLKI